MNYQSQKIITFNICITLHCHYSCSHPFTRCPQNICTHQSNKIQ